MLKKFAATLLVPLIAVIVCLALFAATGNILPGVLALLFGAASVYYARELFRPGQAPERPADGDLPAVRVCNYSDGHLVGKYAYTLFPTKTRDGRRDSVDVDISNGHLYRVTRDAAGKITAYEPVTYEELRGMSSAGRFRNMTAENWEGYLPEKQRLYRRELKQPLKIPAAYCGYQSRNPVTKFYYTVSMPDRNIVVYFRSTEDGYRVFQAQACEPGPTAAMLSESGDPDLVMEEILAGGYQNKHFDACDRRLSPEETACIQHLFDHEANAYQTKHKDLFANSYICRKKSRRVTSGSRYAFFMQYVLQAIACRGAVVTAGAEEGFAAPKPEDAGETPAD